MKNTTLLHLTEYSIYKNFLKECRNKIYSDDLALHNHHIIPRCLGGGNEKTNMIKLSVDDHAKAHLLMSNCFDENSYEQSANLKSARIIGSKSIKDKETLEKIANAYCGENNPFYGKTHTDETKKKYVSRHHRINQLFFSLNYSQKVIIAVSTASLTH